MKRLAQLAMLAALASFLVALAACGGRDEASLPACKAAAPDRGSIVPANSSDCRSDQDCWQDGLHIGLFCYSGGPYCGMACSPDESSCRDNSMCGAGQACVEIGCCGGRCVPMHDRCDTTSYTCPENHDCKPADPSADVRGCVVRGCEIDLECDCGACVNGSCSTILGACVPLAA